MVQGSRHGHPHKRIRSSCIHCKKDGHDHVKGTGDSCRFHGEGSYCATHNDPKHCKSRSVSHFSPYDVKKTKKAKRTKKRSKSKFLGIF